MHGTVCGDWLESNFQAELQAANTSSLYGVRKAEDGSIHIDGACGFESVRCVAEKIGMTVKSQVNKKGKLTGWIVVKAGQPISAV